MERFNKDGVQENTEKNISEQEEIVDSFAEIEQTPSLFNDIRDEETASEIMPDNVSEENDHVIGSEMGSAIGWIALALSVISFFIMPIVLGAAAIIVGFVARARGVEWLGNTAIAIGIISIIVRMFIFPFI